MSSKLSYAAIFTAFVLTAAVIQWPAAWLQGWVEQASDGRWKLSGAEGTIWNGSASLLLTENSGNRGRGSSRVFQNISWKLRGNELWNGRLVFETSLEQGNVLITLNATEWSMEKLDAQLPASALAGLTSGPMGRYGWTGLLQARSAVFKCSLQGRDCTGEVELLWKDAGVTEVPGPVLGSYRIRIVGEGPSVHFDLTTLEGRLQLAGKGEIGAAGLRFTGEASATGADAGPLEAKLRTLGRPAGSAGRYVIEYRESGTS